MDNALEDVTPPQYVPGSIRVEIVPDVVTEADGPHPVHRAHITWLVNENRTMGDGYSVHAYFNIPGSYSHQNWGVVNSATSLAAVDITLTDFDLSGIYGVPSIMMIDAAGNRTTTVFANGPGYEAVTSAAVVTTNPDTQAPEVSLNEVPEQGLHQIQISAQPTHPEAPDGETLVTIRYQARDDKSGLGQVVYRLLDPQGLSHRDYHYHDNFYTTFFQGDPTAWKDYTIHLVLPTGSAPGTWGLQELVVSDKAGNQQLYDFVEIMHFEVSAAP